MRRITINNEEVTFLRNTLTIDDAIGERASASFTVKTDLDTRFEQGQLVTIYDDNNVIFAGVIEKPTETRPPGSDILYHTITCKDWHYLADKRIIAKAYAQARAGDIVRDIAREKLTDEGVIVSEEFTWREYEDLTWGDL